MTTETPVLPTNEYKKIPWKLVRGALTIGIIWVVLAIFQWEFELLPLSFCVFPFYLFAVLLAAVHALDTLIKSPAYILRGSLPYGGFILTIG